MTTAAETALIASLEAWAAETIPGAMVTGFILQVAAETIDDVDEITHYLRFAKRGQPFHVSTGLAEYLAGKLADERGETT